MRWTESVVKHVLPNGLTLLVQRDPSAAVVAAVTHVRAGYFDEPDAWSGIAHVLEHMYFKGTARRGPGVLARETQRLGGYLNAATIYDKTIYYTVLPAAEGGLERAIDLQADALMHLALDSDELRRELEVIIQEAKRKLDTPHAVTGETLYELLFDVHRMRRWRIGTETGLRALTADDLRAYYRSRYVPERTIVALVGDLETDQALELATAAYGGWVRTAPPIPGSPAESRNRHARRRVLNGDVQRPLAAVGWRTVPQLHPDAVPLDIASVVLGGGRGSWLGRAVRLTGLAESVSAGNYSAGDVGVFDVSLTADVETLDRAVDRALSLAAALGAEGPGDDDIARVRSLVTADWAQRLESCDGRAMTLCAFEALGDVHLADVWYDRMLEVTPDAVRRAAADYLTPDLASAVLYLPSEVSRNGKGPWPSVPEVSPPGKLEMAKLPAAAHRNRSVTAPAADEVAEGIFHRSLPGADLVVATKRGSALVSIGAYFGGLATAETADTAGISRLLARASLRGAAGLGAEALAASAELLGGSVEAVTGTETVGWVLTARAGVQERAAMLLRDIAAEAALDADAVVAERTLQVGDARRVRDDMFRYPLQQVLARAFADDPYGLPTIGDPDRLAGITAEQVRTWGERLRTRRALVVAVGDREPEALLDGLGAFAEWLASERDERGGHPVPAWHADRDVESREKAQSALAMAFPAPAAPHPARHVLSVASAILSGLAGRLFEELRERRALAYTVQAAPWLRRRAGAMLAYIATSPEREDEARDAMLDELARLARAPIGDEELDRARRYAAGLVAIRRQHTRAIEAEIANAWVDGTIDTYAEEEMRLRAVRAEDVTEAASSVFDAARRAEFVVRGTGAAR